MWASPEQRRWDPCPPTPNLQCAGGRRAPHKDASGKILGEEPACAAPSWTPGATACPARLRSQISASSSAALRLPYPEDPTLSQAPRVLQGKSPARLQTRGLGLSWTCLHHPPRKVVPKEQTLPEAPLSIRGTQMGVGTCSLLCHQLCWESRSLEGPVSPSQVHPPGGQAGWPPAQASGVSTG